MDTSTEKVSNYVVVSKIPAPMTKFRRSASLRVRGERGSLVSIPSTPFPSILEKEEDSGKGHQPRGKLSLNLNRSRSHASVVQGNVEDDLDSLDSFVSNASLLSTKSSCEHAHFAKNGTTYSGRLHKYIVHCQTAPNNYEEYLTPTQRANRSIKRLKTLLQLAKEKLREKEEEIFKLTKEVVELKVFKASVNSDFSDASTPSHPQPEEEEEESPEKEEENSVINCENCDAGVQAGFDSPGGAAKMKDFECDAIFNDFSPLKNSYYFDENNESLKTSPASPRHGFGEKMSATPDFLLASLADSGNFDDMASSVSLHSKDSVGFAITPDLRPLPGEKLQEEGDNCDSREREQEKLVILNMYENKLREKKLEYEMELKRIIDEQEEKNVRMMSEFENRLKEEELKFEERWLKLLKTSEEEKQLIVDRFEQKLAEEKEKYMEDLLRSRERKVSDSYLGEAYARTVEEEKSIYQSSLQRIKAKFDDEKLLIETNFDETLKQERRKFEESVNDIKQMGNARIAKLLETIAELDSRYKELMRDYQEAVTRNDELETENRNLKQAMEEQDERHKNTYLKLYMKGQEAAKLEHEHQIAEAAAHQGSNEALVPELLVKLKVTEAELESLKVMYKRLAELQAKASPKEVREENNAEATIQFLKSAVYYFLTDRENRLGHLRAIESILGFSADEKSKIEKSYPY